MAAAQQVVVVSINYRMCVYSPGLFFNVSTHRFNNVVTSVLLFFPLTQSTMRVGGSLDSLAARSSPPAQTATAQATSEFRTNAWRWSGRP